MIQMLDFFKITDRQIFTFTLNKIKKHCKIFLKELLET